MSTCTVMNHSSSAPPRKFCSSAMLPSAIGPRGSSLRQLSSA
jgi:hypothetical protein